MNRYIRKMLFTYFEKDELHVSKISWFYWSHKTNWRWMRNKKKNNSLTLVGFVDIVRFTRLFWLPLKLGTLMKCDWATTTWSSPSRDSIRITRAPPGTSSSQASLRGAYAQLGAFGAPTVWVHRSSGSKTTSSHSSGSRGMSKGRVRSRQANHWYFSVKFLTVYWCKLRAVARKYSVVFARLPSRNMRTAWCDRSSNGVVHQ